MSNLHTDQGIQNQTQPTTDEVEKAIPADQQSVSWQLNRTPHEVNKQTNIALLQMTSSQGGLESNMSREKKDALKPTIIQLGELSNRPSRAAAKTNSGNQVTDSIDYMHMPPL